MVTAEQIADRLKKLQEQYDMGKQALSNLEAQRNSVATTVARIEGAMQVLREMAAPPAEPLPIVSVNDIPTPETPA
jgi:chromosome segregation ATPase